METTHQSAESTDGLRLKSLLAPTDFSETAGAALDYAVSLAGQFGAELNLIHVVEPPKVFMDPKPIFAEWDRQVLQRARERLDKMAGEKIDKQIPLHVEVQAGRAYQRICEAAERLSTDIIVISTHGFTGLKHLLLGSTTDQVVRHAPCSVLVVPGRQRPTATTELKPKRILVPTDFSGPAIGALQHAMTLAAQFQAELLLLYVVPTYYSVAGEMVTDIAMLESELEESGENQLAGLVKTISSKGVSVRTLIRRGRPSTEITETIKELDSDLVVISTHGATGWNRVLLGSTTEEVVRQAACPVLVVRRK